MKVNIDVDNHTYELWVYIQKLKGKLETFRKAPSKISQPTYMNN